MVGERRTITSARTGALRELQGMGWLSALGAPQVKELAKNGGPLQMSLFDEVNFCEVTHPGYPGERLVCAKDPLLAEERAKNRVSRHRCGPRKGYDQDLCQAGLG